MTRRGRSDKKQTEGLKKSKRRRRSARGVGRSDPGSVEVAQVGGDASGQVSPRSGAQVTASPGGSERVQEGCM